MNDFAERNDEFHFFECLVEGDRGHFTSLKADHASEFTAGGQVRGDDAKVGARNAIRDAFGDTPGPDRGMGLPAGSPEGNLTASATTMKLKLCRGVRGHGQQQIASNGPHEMIDKFSELRELADVTHDMREVVES